MDTLELGLLKKMFDKVFDVILIISKQGDIEYINPSAANFYGYTEEEWEHKTIFDLRSEENKEVILKQIDQALESSIEFETIHTRKDGSRIPVLVRSVNSGMVDQQSVVSIIHDEGSLFLADMSHEIGTPLNGLVAAVDMLKKEDLTSSQRKVVSVIERSTENLRAILTGILDITKVDRGEAEIEPEWFSISALMEELFRELQVSANQRGLEASVYIDPEIVGRHWGDYKKIRKILCNLMNHALVFTEHGYMGIKVKIMHQEREMQTMEFSVKTSGVGTGMGLPISKRYARAIGGELYFEHEEQAGSIFYLQCTLCNQKQVSEAKQDVIEKKEKSSVEKGKICVLSIDDNVVNQQLMEFVFPERKYTVILAYSAEEALEILKQEEVDIILMDIQLPGMNGYRLTEKIKKQEKVQEVPILGMTAYARMEDREKCLQAGMDDYISKPIDINNLMDKVQRLVKK